MGRFTPDLLGTGAFNDQTGVTYTLVLDDAPSGTRHTPAGGADCTVTIPLHANVPFPRHVQIPIRMGGATGTLTIVGGANVSVNAPHGATATGKGDARVLEQTDIDVWTVW